MKYQKQSPAWLSLVLIGAVLLSACQAQAAAMSPGQSDLQAPANNQAAEKPAQDPAAAFTPVPTRPIYAPGELVDYTAQTGDTLALLALRFNTTVDEILQANTFIPASATTMPPGMPMKIPIYYLPFWGSSYRILPDSLFIDGPAQINFDTSSFIAAQPGWLNGYVEYASGANRSAAQIIDLVALDFSISPRLLLALLEYESAALSQADPSEQAQTYPMGYRERSRQGLYRQLLWSANLLNDGYYAWRTGKLLSLDTKDGRQIRFDPWQNAATASLHNYFNTLLSTSQFEQAISPAGLAQTYRTLFGDPWENETPHIPGSLQQPALMLPFEPGNVWAYTGGPHTAWGSGQPYAAIDFAPPLTASGCQTTAEWATAVADGVVVRSETGVVVLDLDGDGDERTGWDIFYLHLATEGRASLGQALKAGDPIGHPSCEGGTATGTHVHIARKYNGEWILADSIVPFNLESWVVHNGRVAYEGTLTRMTSTVIACVCSNQASFIQSDKR